MNTPTSSMGVMTIIPTRIPHLSPTHPTRGKAKRPGKAQRDPMLNPIARARGGIARERAATSPGPRIAKEKVRRALKPTAIHTVGDSAKPITNNDPTKADTASSRRISAGSRETSFTPSPAPTISPKSCAGSTPAAINPRVRSSRSKTSS